MEWIINFILNNWFKILAIYITICFITSFLYLF